ncbi:MAG: hypothetical protein GXP49_11275 [Deltaproteobacteria bacterium]|nr:hypothetical protein [Deltaproteobacteria bacterium]
MSLKKLASLIVLISAFGCGPVESTSVILDAEAACAKAEIEHADKVQGAAYYYFAAEQYLDKAKEEQGYSDFEIAIDYGRRAKKLADKARSIAIANPKSSQ